MFWIPFIDTILKSHTITCWKCGYTWLPKKPDPKECPECKVRRSAQSRGEMEILTKEDFLMPSWNYDYMQQHDEDDEEERHIDTKIGTAIRAIVFLQIYYPETNI